MGELGLRDEAEGRRRYAERMRRRAAEELAAVADTPSQPFAGRWYLGDESFRERILRLLDASTDKLRTRREMDRSVRRTHDEEEAKRLLKTGLETLGLTGIYLSTIAKGDVRKLALAAVVREHTAVPKAWIATELQLGHVSRLRKSAPTKNGREPHGNK